MVIQCHSVFYRRFKGWCFHLFKKTWRRCKTNPTDCKRFVFRCLFYSFSFFRATFIPFFASVFTLQHRSNSHCSIAATHFCFHIAASQQHCSNSLGKLINSNFLLLFALNIVEEVLGEDQFLNSFSSCSISIANSFKIKPVPPALSGPHNYFFREIFGSPSFFFSFKKLT